MDSKELETLIRGLVERYLSGGAQKSSESSEPAQERKPFPGHKVVTEMEVRDAGLGGTVPAVADAIVTAAAADLAKSWGVTILRGNNATVRPRRIAVGADHGGYELKVEMVKFLSAQEGLEIVDFGTGDNRPVDYPDFAHAVAIAVSSGKADLGIVVDGAGIGSAMAANKVPGIRAAMCYDAATARNSREHNFANVLTLGGRLIDTARMQEIVKSFLETEPGEERHAARVRKILDLEKRYMKSPS
jgi:ribose 5-phosphate isomerase B